MPTALASSGLLSVADLIAWADAVLMPEANPATRSLLNWP